MDEQNVDWNFLLWVIHICNAEERAIRTFKNNFKLVLASTDEDFPIHIWCRLIQKSCTTLNLLLKSIINPRLLAEVKLNVAFNYNSMPLEPPKKRVMIHEKLGKCGTLYPQGVKVWYIGRVPYCYFFFKV